MSEELNKKMRDTVFIKKIINPKEIEKIREELRDKWKKIGEKNYSSGKFIEGEVYFEFEDKIYVFEYGAMSEILEIYRVQKREKQSPYRFKSYDCKGTLNLLICPYCHKTLDVFRNESYFDENECRFCGLELERSDYQKFYDLQVKLSLRNGD